MNNQVLRKILARVFVCGIVLSHVACGQHENPPVQTLASAINLSENSIVSDEVLLSGKILQQNFNSQYQDIILKNATKTSGPKQQFLGYSSGLEFWTSIIERLGSYAVPTRAVEYMSKNAKGEAIKLSGRVFMPGIWCNTSKPVSVILFSHATEFRRWAVPSRLTGMEDVFGAAAAFGTCSIVAMPDLPGLGADPAFHPFVHAKSLAYSMLDMLPAVEKVINNYYANSITWNHKFATMGYSEGGYVSLATVKEVHTNPAYMHLKRNLVAGAAISGPYSISNAMVNVMLGDKPLKFPSFLPYTIRSYESVYGEAFKFEKVFKKELLEPTTYSGTLKQWTDGNYHMLTIDSLIVARMGEFFGTLVPRKMMNEDYVKGYFLPPDQGGTYPNNLAGKAMKENDLGGGWTPEVPILLWSSPDDDAVPYENTTEAYALMSAALRKKNQDPSSLLSLVKFGEAGSSLGHVGSCVYGYADGFSYINNKLKAQ